MASEFLQQFYDEQRETNLQEERIKKLAEASMQFHQSVNAFYTKYYGSEQIENISNENLNSSELISTQLEDMIDLSPVQEENVTIQEDFNKLLDVKDSLDDEFENYISNVDLDSILDNIENDNFMKL